MSKKDAKATRTRQPYLYDAVIEGVRVVTSCNRSNFKAMAVEQYVSQHIDPETREVDLKTIITDLNDYKTRNPTTSSRQTKEKIIPTVVLE